MAKLRESHDPSSQVHHGVQGTPHIRTAVDHQELLPVVLRVPDRTLSADRRA